jgi:hypothetical protein
MYGVSSFCQGLSVTSVRVAVQRCQESALEPRNASIRDYSGRRDEDRPIAQSGCWASCHAEVA